MRIVEHYSDGESLPVQTSEHPDLIPVPALIEDAESFRYLLVGPEPTIPVRTWAKAYEAGACALVSQDPGGRWLVLPTQRFIENRRELPQQAAFELAVASWFAYDGPLLFTDLISFFPPEYFLDDRPLVESEREAAAQSEVGGRFVSLHTHSEFSALDGLSRVQEAVAAVVADGQQALAFSDHGNCAVHPEQQAECLKAGIKPIFGMEAYFVDDRLRRPVTRMVLEDGKEVKKSDAAEVRDYDHITLWAMDNTGLRNLWAMSTESYRDGFYYYPRLDWDVLGRLNEGVIASTGCLRGPLARAIESGDDMKVRTVLARMLDIFDDRLYIEIHTNSLDRQRKVNEESLRYAKEFGIPIIACTDSHYTHHEDAQTHTTWLAVQTNKDVTEETGLFGGAPEYFMHTAEEVEKALSYLPADQVELAMSNTVALANRCSASIQGVPTAPTYSKGENAVADDERRLREVCEANWARKVVGKRDDEQVYRDRFEREMDLLVRKQFTGYFLVVWDYVAAAKREGILVGPGRGSGGGSLVAYLAGIVEIDPVFYDLIFERFLTEGRKDLPDFDIDFPASKRDWIKNYVRKRWGEDHVVTIGTVLRLQAKSAINDALRAIKPTLGYEPDYLDFKTVSQTIKDAERSLAGKALAWDDLWAQFGDVLDPIRSKYPPVFAAADNMVGRLKSYGKHAAGVVISTDLPLTDLPLRTSDDGQMVTQFDMNALQLMGYVKFDFLTLRTLDTIQDTIDLIQQTYGKKIDVYSWREELEDPQVWEEVAAGHTLGLFQVETKSGTKLTKQLGPTSVDDLAVVMTIVRPGPDRSGLKDIYLRRRAGLEPVTVPDPRMESFLGPTLGCMIYQEQVMATCMQIAGYTATEAEGVRKILGKKLVEQAAEAGKEFIRRAIECDTDPEVAKLLWSQMEEFAKYGFGKAHAYGYAVLGAWTAWLKIHFPIETLASLLSTVDDDRIPEFVQEAKRMGYQVKAPDINRSGVLFTREGTTIRYGIASIKGISSSAAPIVAGQPYASVEDFIDRMVTPKGSPVNSGDLASLAAVGAFDELFPNRRALEQRLTWEASGAHKICQSYDSTTVGPGGLPCTFDWLHEADPPMVKIKKKDQVPGGPTETPKPPPARCTVACRQYRRPEPFDVELVVPYTADDILQRERETLGVWLSGTPFDRMPKAQLETAHKASDIEAGPIDQEYITIALVNRVVPKTTKNGDRYAWVTLFAQDGEFDAACWPDQWAKYRPVLNKDALIVAIVVKDGRGTKLTGLAVA
jgi:DNA polymerase-3 subunit alpha